MDRAFKDVEKKNLLNSKFFLTLFKILNSSERKQIEDLQLDEIYNIVKFIFNSLSVQKDKIVY